MTIQTIRPNQEGKNSPSLPKSDYVKGLLLKSNLNLLSITKKPGERNIQKRTKMMKEIGTDMMSMSRFKM